MSIELTRESSILRSASTVSGATALSRVLGLVREQVTAYFVHDYESEAWMRGETAFYVRSEKVKTPMGHGIAAFETREAADRFAAEYGAQTLTFDELRLAVHEDAHG